VYVFDVQDHLLKKHGSRGIGIMVNLRIPVTLPLMVKITCMWLIEITTGYKSLMLVVIACCSLEVVAQDTVNCNIYMLSQHLKVECIADKGNCCILVFKCDGQFCISWFWLVRWVAVNGKSQLLLVAVYSHLYS